MGTKTSYIDFRLDGTTKSGKTQIWSITTHAGIDGPAHVLGKVKWHSGWRRYAFFPARDTLYEQTCLREISDFIESVTERHKVGW